MPKLRKKPKVDPGLTEVLTTWVDMAAALCMTVTAFQKARDKIEEDLKTDGKIECRKVDLLLWAAKYRVGIFADNPAAKRAVEKRLGYKPRVSLEVTNTGPALFSEMGADFEYDESLDDISRLEQNIQHAQRMVHRFGGIIENFNVEALETPRIADSFGRINATYMQMTEKLGKFEKQMIDLRKQHRELIPATEAQDLMSIVADGFKADAQKLIMAVLDLFKAEELEVYKESKLDSNLLKDKAALKLDEYFQKIANGLKSGLSQIEQEQADG